VSRKECVNDKEIINTAKLNGLKYASKKGDTANKEVATRLTWIPGIKPVTMPMRIPNDKTSNNSTNISKILNIISI
jgi:hypothetical protein